MLINRNLCFLFALGLISCFAACSNRDSSNETESSVQPAHADHPAHSDHTKQSARSAQPARVGLDKAGQMHFSPEDRCPVCAMQVTEHSKFASGIQLQDGRTFYFCGTGCMIRAWLHPEVFLSESKASLSKGVVREYFAGEHIDAQKAHFVAGSDVIGPMGPALVPLKNQSDLETFKQRHGGKRVFQLDELDDARWKSITGKNILAGREH